MQIVAAVQLGDRNEVAAVELGAMQCERVDLRRLIDAPSQAVARSAVAVKPSGDDVSVPRSPLALNAEQLSASVEDEVVTEVQQGFRTPIPNFTAW